MQRWVRAHMLSCFSHVCLFVTPWTVAHQVLPFVGFSRREQWSGLPCPPAGDLPDPGTEPQTLVSLAWQALYYLCHLGSTTKVAGSFLKVGRTSTQQKFNLKKINSKMQNKKKKITNFLLESFRDHWGRAFLTQQGETELWSLKQTLRSHDNN